MKFGKVEAGEVPRYCRQCNSFMSNPCDRMDGWCTEVSMFEPTTNLGRGSVRFDTEAGIRPYCKYRGANQ